MPTSSASPRSQPSERITTTAPRVSAAPAPLVVVRLERRRRSACRPTSRCTRAAAASSAASGSRVAELRRDPRQPRAERERLDPAPRAARRVQVEQQRPRVRLHRAGDVEDQHELPRSVGPAAERALDRVAAGRERRAHEPAHVERVPASSRGAGVACAAAAARRAIAWISFRARANSSGVIAAKSLRPQELLLAPGAEPRLAAVDLRAGARRRALAALAVAAAARPRRELPGCTATPRNQASNARSNASRSSRRETSVWRSVQ